MGLGGCQRREDSSAGVRRLGVVVTRRTWLDVLARPMRVLNKAGMEVGPLCRDLGFPYRTTGQPDSFGILLHAPRALDAGRL